MRKLAKWAAEMGNVEKVELLPFHKMGEWKWKKYDLPYRLSDTRVPEPEEIEHFSDIFRKYGLIVE